MIKILSVALGLLLVTTSMASAAIWVASGGNKGTGNTVSAEADFTSVDGTGLQIVLKNTTPGGTLALGDVLAEFFFSAVGSPQVLYDGTHSSAIARLAVQDGQLNRSDVDMKAYFARRDSSDKALPQPGDVTHNVGTWELVQPFNHTGFGYGLGTFGDADLGGGFHGSLVGNDNYAIVAPGTNLSNDGLTDLPFAQDSVTFTLAGFGSLADHPITAVRFVFGSPPNAPLDGAPGTAIPEPATLIVWSVLGASGVGIGWWRRRRVA